VLTITADIYLAATLPQGRRVARSPSGYRWLAGKRWDRIYPLSHSALPWAWPRPQRNESLFSSPSAVFIFRLSRIGFPARVMRGSRHIENIDPIINSLIFRECRPRQFACVETRFHRTIKTTACIAELVLP
jgi:hypothetical protein